MKNIVLDPAHTRGFADHGWLKTYHTFSFANYYNPQRVHFGMLRVLNDDTVMGGEGFDTHPHENMEIITIPLQGALQHRDSMGNVSVITHGEIQVMSAGTGILHSEFNHHPTQPVQFLQIWLFPNKKEVTPRYDQMKLNLSDRVDRLQQVLSPHPHDEGVWIHQEAWFYMAQMRQGLILPYTLKNPDHGVYLFVIQGAIQVGMQTLNARDGMGMEGVSSVEIESLHPETELLLMEIPMR